MFEAGSAANSWVSAGFAVQLGARPGGLDAWGSGLGMTAAKPVSATCLDVFSIDFKRFSDLATLLAIPNDNNKSKAKVGAEKPQDPSNVLNDLVTASSAAVALCLLSQGFQTRGPDSCF